jgi:hypothetical protein
MALTLSTKDAQELVYGGDFTDEGLTVEDDRQTGSSRWESHHTVVVRDRDGKLWAADYRKGLTENQESRPFENEAEVTFREVIKVPVTVFEYRPV